VSSVRYHKPGYCPQTVYQIQLQFRVIIAPEGLRRQETTIKPCLLSCKVALNHCQDQVSIEETDNGSLGFYR